MNNRRASERHSQLRVPVQLRPLAPGNTLAGTALNLSEGGVLVDVPRNTVKSPPGVVLGDIAGGGATSRLEAVVQRAEEHRVKARLGLRFVNLGEHERHALRLHLRENS